MASNVSTKKSCLGNRHQSMYNDYSPASSLTPVRIDSAQKGDHPFKVLNKKSQFARLVCDTSTQRDGNEHGEAVLLSETQLHNSEEIIK